MNLRWCITSLHGPCVRKCAVGRVYRGATVAGSAACDRETVSGMIGSRRAMVKGWIHRRGGDVYKVISCSDI